ncbi:6-phosphofructokinase [Salipaludibacillus sp. LMS25]|jgi:6-phosphofructokinase 1|uniref:6-phosphofructokinase n=1 Tax=Salipaludibacillus sp. LMS25 TaxID=2924031 RepID=UPI0020D1324A|nr:6-phosphofructokinase [Salipaludibacillus sp. LMS25]UTR14897.1 6-phosphofructokinase [Salipaludibacillus sp. LMS25]
MNRIAVLTSGGDAPGMNAAIRAVVRAAVVFEIQIFGVYRGFHGLIEGDFIEMDPSSVGDIIHKGGTILKSSRSEEFKTKEGRMKALSNLKEKGIDGLVVIGGDGSFQGAKKLSDMGIKTIGLPGTIDNDLHYTDYTIGFDTAVNTVLEAITKIRDTSTSHEKATIIEVMGRNCGDIALYAGLAGGAESIMIPEDPISTEHVVTKLKAGKARGKEHHIIVLAEGVGKAADLQKELLEKAEMNARMTVLGFIQRGGDPTSFDRILASKMGIKAVELLRAGETNKVIGIKNNALFHMDIGEALKATRSFNHDMINMTEILSV